MAETTDEVTSPTVTEGMHSSGKSQPVSQSGLWLAVLAVLGVGALGTWAWMQNQKVSNDIQKGAAEIESLSQRISTLPDNLAESLSQLDSKLQTLQTEQAQLQQAVNRQRTTREHFESDWQLTDALFMSRLAQQRLQISGDIETAQQVLSSVDEAVKRLGGGMFEPIREAIAQDKLALQAVNRPDIAAVAHQIDAITAMLMNLDTQAVRPQNAQANASEVASKAQAGIRSELEDAWKSLKGLIQIREHDEKALPRLTSEQQLLLKLWCAIKLDEAKWALINHQQATFSEALSQVSRTLQIYFQQPQKPLAAIHEQLAALAQIELDSSLPILATPGAIESAMTQLEEKRT
jgi:uroporphyrin-III C-methyltransferase